MTDTLFSTTSLHTFGGASFAVFLIVQVLHRVSGIKQVATEWLTVGVWELLFLSTTRPFPASVAGWIVLGLNGLLSAEVNYIHSLGISLGLIYGSIPHETLSFQDGVNIANTVAKLAADLGAPTYVTIYADLGTSYDDYITAEFLEGYAYQLTVKTAYHPGFYGNVGTDSAFDNAFATAYNDSTYGSYIANAQLWSAEPEPVGCTSIAGAPNYEPYYPSKFRYVDLHPCWCR